MRRRNKSMQPEEFITNYQTALASQNWINIEPLIAPNACVTFSTGSVHRGTAAIKAAYEYNFSLIKNEAYAIENVHWLMKEADVAVYIFSFKWQGFINGESANGSGHGTAVIKSIDGIWKLLAEHLGK